MNDLILSSLQTQELSHHGKALGAVYGAGAIGTEVAPTVTVSAVNGMIVTKIYIDPTGLDHSNTLGDVVGLASSTDASLFKWDPAVHGDVIVRSTCACIELPTATSNPCLDFDLISATDQMGEDEAVASEGDHKDLFIAGANNALGTTIVDNDVEQVATAQDYVYLAVGAAPGGAATHTAGKLVFTIEAYKLF